MFTPSIIIGRTKVFGFSPSRSSKAAKSVICALWVGLLAFSAFLQTETLYAQESGPRDILEFVGVLSEEQARDFVVEKDCFLISLKRRANFTFDSRLQNYYLLVRDVPALEMELLKDAADGRWDQFSLLRAALIAEGIQDPAKIRAYEEKLGQTARSLREKINGELEIPAQSVELTRMVFEGLHRNILTGSYGIENSNPSIALDRGNFNCVSATVLFNCLAEMNGVHVVGLEKTGHVFSRVFYDASSFDDTETTCPTWFELKTRGERVQIARSVLGENAAPTEYATTALRSLNNDETRIRAAKPLFEPSTSAVEQSRAKVLAGSSESVRDTSQIREISSVQLVAAIYYNRGHDFWQSNHLPEAVLATAKALHLDPENENAWGNLIGAINNIALGFSMEQQQHEIAAGLLDQIALLDPGFKDLQSNRFYVYSTWIRQLVSDRKLDEAAFVFVQARERLPDYARHLDRLEKIIR